MSEGRKRGEQLSLWDEPAAPPEERAPAPKGEPAWHPSWDNLPDVRDGLTRVERVILLCLQQAQEEKRGRMVSTAMLYGRVVEHVDVSVPEFQRILQRLVGIR
jgi:hypothetical protein